MIGFNSAPIIFSRTARSAIGPKSRSLVRAYSSRSGRSASRELSTSVVADLTLRGSVRGEQYSTDSRSLLAFLPLPQGMCLKSNAAAPQSCDSPLDLLNAGLTGLDDAAPASASE